jgi:hypothetical protein
VLGRKGAGKTAISRHLTENPRDFLAESDLLVPLSFEDYNWSIMPRKSPSSGHFRSRISGLLLTKFYGRELADGIVGSLSLYNVG